MKAALKACKVAPAAQIEHVNLVVKYLIRSNENGRYKFRYPSNDKDSVAPVNTRIEFRPFVTVMPPVLAVRVAPDAIPLRLNKRANAFKKFWPTVFAGSQVLIAKVNRPTAGLLKWVSI